MTTPALKIIKSEDKVSNIIFRKMLEEEIKNIIKVPSMREDTNKLTSYITWFNSSQLNNHFEIETINTIVAETMENCQQPTYINDKGNIIPYYLAEFLRNEYSFISDNHYIYKYNTSHYKIEDNVYTIVEKYIEDKEKITSRTVNEIEFQLKHQTLVKAVQQQRGYINFKNGLYDIDKRELVPHDPKIITLGTINAEYNPTCSIEGTKFEKFILTSLGKEYINIIGELIGVSLYPITDKINYFYTLVGDGRNGKGVLLELLTNLVPKTLRSSVPIGSLGEKFANSTLKTSILNIASDDDTIRLESIGILKTLTSAEEFQIQEKGKDPINIKPILTHISAFNSLPSIMEKESAYWDRNRIIPFNKSFGTAEEVARGEKDFIRDPHLKNDLNQELDIIASFGVNCLLNIIDRGYKFEDTEEMLKAKQHERLKTDSTRQWIEERVTPLIGALKQYEYVTIPKMYNAYCLWCSNEGYKQVGRPQFNKILEAEGKVWQSKVISRQLRYGIVIE